MSGLFENAAIGWPLAGALALVVVADRLRAGRRREALNRALHELRRPLQLLALAPVPAPLGPAPVELAIAAMAQLEREINGGMAEPPRPVCCRELAGGAVARWRSRAALAGGSIAFRWRAGAATVVAQPGWVSQALDNLIVNALEHGGPNLVVEGREGSGKLRISVCDDGAGARPAARSGSPAEVIARLTGRRRRGYGLEVVMDLASAAGGRFALQRSEQGSTAVLELPLAEVEGSLAA
jgi:signal transduction histidine kinase